MKTGVLSSINSITLMITLIVFSMTLLSYVFEVKAQSASVSDTGSGTGIVTCPRGEQYEGPIAFESTSTASSVSGEWHISINGPSGNVFKSGVITTGNVSSSGHFILTGIETSDGICANFGGTSPISIEIVGECISGPIEEVLTMVKFRASNGERGDFLSSPTCR